ncbi:YybH family protein [Rhodopirellula sallentina]|uniref:YybH family protein n=1 Tax=Rhodopirellula sallentina TaxID=1263869 RepID=UPI001F2034E7|nr:SgcJ/EcaC family oxidoreductase [Rhodopirellula sallentina]
MKSAIFGMTMTVCTLCCLPYAGADEATDREMIQKEVQAYVDAFNQRDAKTLASKWSSEAVYTNPLSGEQVVGREAIEQQFATIFANDPAVKLAVTSNSIDFLSPSVAIEKGTAIVSRSAPSGDDPADPKAEPLTETSEYRGVYVKQDGHWLLDRVTEEELISNDSPYEHLGQLEWLIGSWVDEDDQARIESTYRWTQNRRFIVQMFSVNVGGVVEMSGMQIIGWDQNAENIRSWVFDSEGGFGEGTWSEHGDAWHIQDAGTLPDGSVSTSTNILTYVDNNQFTWQSVNRVVGGQLLPNVSEVVVKRDVKRNQ